MQIGHKIRPSLIDLGAPEKKGKKDYMNVIDKLWKKNPYKRNLTCFERKVHFIIHLLHNKF